MVYRKPRTRQGSDIVSRSAIFTKLQLKIHGNVNRSQKKRLKDKVRNILMPDAEDRPAIENDAIDCALAESSRLYN